MTAAQIIDAVRDQLGTEASRATVLSMLNEVYAAQIADSRWFRTQSSIGTTTAGDDTYTVPTTVVQAFGVKVGGYPYTPIGEDQMWRIKAATATVRSGSGGVFSTSYDSTGSTILTLHPIPATTGSDILLYAAVQPSALTDSGSSTPVTPADSHSSLIAGTAALVLARVDERPELAAVFKAEFDQWTEKLRRRRNQLLRGGQPAMFQIAGIHF